MQVTDLARQLARLIAPRAAEADRTGKLPPEDMRDLRASGYAALSVPVRYGGAGLGLGEAVRAQLELAQGSTSTALVAAMQLHIFGNAAEGQPWGEATFAAFCERAVRGELFNSAASEPTLGSPSRGGLPQTEVRLEGDSLHLNGHKTWVTGGAQLDNLLVSARYGEESVMVWLPVNSPGVRWHETWGGGLSLRASDSHDLLLENVTLPAAHLIGQGRGHDGPNLWFPTLMAATYLGAALAARDAVIRYAQARIPTALGKPISTLPKIQRQLGEIEVALKAARTLLETTADAWTGRGDRSAYYPQIVAAKHLATETALTVTDTALRIAGGASIGTELPLERLFRDVRAGLMHPPSGDSALEIVGRAAVDSLS